MSLHKYQRCIAACSECAVECKYCANECLHEQDIKMLVRCVKLEQDCAAICLLVMESMAGGSEFVKQFCKLCAEVCTACAVECEKHSHSDHCKKCAEVCRRCAAECTAVSTM